MDWPESLMKEKREPESKLGQRMLLLAVLATYLPIFAQQSSTTHGTPAASSPKEYVGNEPCASCHAEIYKSYARTAMAHASGPASQELIPGDFTHAASGVHYRVYSDAEGAWLSFERPGDPAVSGKRQLQYFIGSGRRGRTYLFSVEGFAFESPINWYAQKRVWDMAPAYQSAREIPMTLPALPACLGCHTSNMKPPAPGTENKYSLPLFAHAGITCERCHGPGAAHATSKGAIINPSKLAPARRDDICMQCHLEGNVAIEQPGKHLYEFQPGDNLADYTHYFVFADDGSRSLRALSQSEALAQSVCKRKAGDAMSCTSCHDPHANPATDEKVSYYRNKCLACHGAELGAKHHAGKPDCRQCHMPAVASEDVAHTQATDHRILRLPAMPLQNLGSSAAPRLVRFPGVSGAEDTRDLALAWASLAEGGMASALAEAETRLRRAVKEKPDDPALLTALGFIEQKHGRRAEARKDYEHALEIDPLDNEAAGNLGVIDAQEGHMERAVSLWQQAFERVPGKSAVGMNLAQVYCSSAQFDQARAYTRRVLQFNPDLPEAKALMRSLNADPPKCAAR
jgi:tetratricopeptide (TPR) repeat protein